MSPPNQTDASGKRRIAGRRPAASDHLWIERSLSGILCILALCLLAAAALVLLGHTPTVFNWHDALVDLLNKASFGALVPVSGALAVHATTGRISRIANVLRLLFFWALTIEGGLW